MPVRVTGADVKHGKPDPEIFLQAAMRLEVPAAACVVVEDAPAGIEAARRAGMRCVGLTSTHDSSALAAADGVVACLSEAGAMIDSWRGVGAR